MTNWLLQTTGGWLLRVGIGVAIFVALALHDLYRRGPAATRWREYMVLLSCVIAAVMYAIVNDHLTASISWEYFAFGKGLAESLPADWSSESIAFRLAVTRLAAQAGFSGGVIVGVALLVANNPAKNCPQFSHSVVLKQLVRIVILTVIISGVVGGLGYFGMFARISADFREMLEQNQWRPRRFMCVYGIHLGAYVGALVGTIASVIQIRRARASLAASAAKRDTAIASAAS